MSDEDGITRTGREAFTRDWQRHVDAHLRFLTDEEIRVLARREKRKQFLTAAGILTLGVGFVVVVAEPLLPLALVLRALRAAWNLIFGG